MAEVLKTIFQLRRGLESAWIKNNPILASGEPGFAIDKNAIKIGDGVTPWNELEYIEGGNNGVNGGVFSAETHHDFPSVGSADVIYKAEIERKIYQWNKASLKYETLSEIEITIQDLDLIHGGNANGTA